MPNLSWHKRAEGHPIKDGLDPRIRSGDESIISELVLLGGTAVLCLLDSSGVVSWNNIS